ncbi:MAG: hypothetical protein WC314_17005 [Vulcanimicrobiota bacterium]
MKKLFLVTVLALFTLGCGGGGDDNPVFQVVTNPTPQPTQTPTGTVEIIPGREKTFEFPSFSNSSKLVVVANHQVTTETSSASAAAKVNLVGPTSTARDLVQGRTDSDLPTGFNPCGYADAYAYSQVLEPEVMEQSSPEIRPRYQELAEGEEVEFNLVISAKKIRARKILEPSETIHCSIFAEVLDGTPVVDRAKALAVAEAFDSDNPQRRGSGIYEQVRALFGSEWNQNPPGGNDGDEKIVIVFFSSKTLGESLFGFVSPLDANPNGGTNSNKGEIIYVNANKPEYQTLATISHEFQHVINLNQKIIRQGQHPSGAKDENVSINEGLSGLSEEICGYTYESGNDLLVRVTNNYLSKPEEHEFFNFYAAGLGYGQGYLFFRYVREHFGDQTIRAISTDPEVGLKNLDDHLGPGFPEVFRRWTIANYATNLQAVPSIYRYPSGLKTNGTYPAGKLVGVKTFPLQNNGDTTSPQLGPWSTAYLAFDSLTGTGLQATVTPAGGSAYGVLFEQLEDRLNSLEGGE